MQMQQCPHCGAAVPAGDRFCGECGRALSDVPAAPSPAASDTPAQPPAIPSWQPPPQPPAAPPAWQPQANPLAATTRPAINTQNLTSPENLAIGSVILGAVDLCLMWVPLISFCTIVSFLANVVMGIVGLKSKNRTLAIIGLALAALWAVLFVVQIILGYASTLNF